MQLKFCEFAKFNDYHEFYRYGIMPLFFDNIDLGKIPYRRFFTKINSFKSICFSVDVGSKKGWNLPCMWAHYGDNHKGVCIEIDLEKLCIDDNFLKRRVNYVESIPVNDFRNPDYYIDSKADSMIDELIKKNNYEILFTKESDWVVEQEFRIITNQNIDFIGISNAITGIYFGVRNRITSKRIKLFEKLLSKSTENSINLYLLHLSDLNNCQITKEQNVMDFRESEKMNKESMQRIIAKRKKEIKKNEP